MCVFAPIAVFENLAFQLELRDTIGHPTERASIRMTPDTMYFTTYLWNRSNGHRFRIDLWKRTNQFTTFYKGEPTKNREYENISLCPFSLRFAALEKKFEQHF